jgi:hypothetical protein
MAMHGMPLAWRHHDTHHRSLERESTMVALSKALTYFLEQQYPSLSIAAEHRSLRLRARDP